MTALWYIYKMNNIWISGVGAVLKIQSLHQAYHCKITVVQPSSYGHHLQAFYYCRTTF